MVTFSLYLSIYLSMWAHVCYCTHGPFSGRPVLLPPLYEFQDGAQVAGLVPPARSSMGPFLCHKDLAFKTLGISSS